MDVNSIINNDGYHAPNPSYKPGNGQPKFIISDDPRYAPRSTAGMFFEEASRGGLNKIGDVSDYENYIKYGITPRRGDSFDDYQRNLADSQSVLEEARNSFIQLLSEGTLGMVKSFADLFDLVTLSQLRENSDYQNVISAQLEKWQKDIRNEYTVWQDPNVNIGNGGLLKTSFLFAGLPSVISSLALLVPSKAASFAGSKLLSAATKKGLQFARNIEKANRANQIGAAARAAGVGQEGGSAVASINAFLASPKGKLLGEYADYGVTGLTSRLLENYQESRQTYDDALPVYKEIIKNMSPEERQKTINNLIGEYGEDAADWGSFEEVSKLIARKAADETFKVDMVNIFSDVYQMWTIGKVGRLMNGPSRSALNRLNRANIKNAGLDSKAIAETLAKRTTAQKAWDKTNDILFGGVHSTLAEVSEGIEEAVNYIAQEEGFHFGKLLLNQEANDGVFSDRLVKYMNSPKLWDSAFWGLAGGVIFNKTAEYANRTTQAIDKIQKSKEKAKINPNEKVLTFREAFRSTELETRKENLNSTADTYVKALGLLDRINNGEDIYGVTLTGKLETEEEKNVSKERVLEEFRNSIQLDAMDVGNYDLVKTYLESEELKQSLIDRGILTKEEADKVQSDILKRSDDLVAMYNSELRKIYSAVSGWGEYNDADLSAIPAEIFQLVARENILNRLGVQYTDKQIADLNAANAVLENDSREALDEARRTTGVASFKELDRRLVLAQNLGIINAEIEELKAKKQHTTAGGQAALRLLEMKKKVIQSSLEQSNQTGNDVEDATNILLSMQAAASVEKIVSADNKPIYRVNTGNQKYIELAEAVNRRDRDVLKSLSPAMQAILDRNEATEDTDEFLNQIVSRANVKNQQETPLYRDGHLVALENINSQLAKNYRALAQLEINKAVQEAQIATTQKEIRSAANDVINSIAEGRAGAIEGASKLYQQLAKKYGKNEVRQEIETFFKTGNHTAVYDQFTKDEKDVFVGYTEVLRLNRPEQDIVLEDIYNALNYNDIYTYTQEEDIVELQKRQLEEIKAKAAQNSSTNQNATQQQQNGNLNNPSAAGQQSNVGQANGQNQAAAVTEMPLEEGEVGEGVVETVDKGTNEGTEGNGAVTTEGEGQPRSSTGEQVQQQEELNFSDVVIAVKSRVEQLEESNPEGVTKEQLKDELIATLSQALPNMERSSVEELADNSLGVVESKLNKKGKSIESALASNVIRLSRIANSNTSEAAIQAAKAIINNSFSELLDNFNKHLARRTVNGKYIIDLESLIRYTRSITNNEYEAQEIYNAFVKIIAENPDKYDTVKGPEITPSKVIANTIESIEDRRANIEKSFSGKTLNIQSMLNNASDEEKAKIRAAVKALKPGDKLYIRPNYYNERIKDKAEGIFIGGFDFVVINENKEEVVICRLPASMKSSDGTHYEANQEMWYYQFPYYSNRSVEEYPIQQFFKYLFTVDSEDGIAFRTALLEYEALPREEAYSKIGEDVLDKAWSILERLSKTFEEAHKNEQNAFEYSLSKLIWKNITTDEANRARIRHLASLDVYTQKKASIDVEDFNYETDEETRSIITDSIVASINQWFDKMIDSSNVRREMQSRLEEGSDELVDIGVEVDSVSNPVLVVTRAENALPATEALSDASKESAVLAAGDPTNRSQVVVSTSTPIALDGSDTTGRSIVFIKNQNGVYVPVNAYPVQLTNSVFDKNVKLKSFKTALLTKLNEILDRWRLNPDSTELLEFLDSLGHKRKGDAKYKGSLFVGFNIRLLDNGNGFSIEYKENNGNIVPPGSREDGVTHYLTFYNTVPTKNGRKARAAVQDYVRTRESNPTIVWNRNPNDTSTLVQLESIRKIIEDVVINSLKVRIDPTNINADNTSNMNYGPVMSKDSDGHLALRVSGISNPPASLQQYIQPNGDILITGLGRNDMPGNFSEFIIFNDLVSLTTKQIDGSNFSIFDHSDGDFGITYRLQATRTRTPVKKEEEVTISKKLSDEVKEKLNSKPNSRTNRSKDIANIILNVVGKDYPSLVSLTKRGTLLSKILHKNVIFVENLNGAKYSANGVEVIVPDTAYAAYIPEDATLTMDGKVVKVKKGDIVIGQKFMELLDGSTLDIVDALRHLIHENVHAFIADNSALSQKYIDEINKLWDEYTRKNPNSVFAKTSAYNDVEEFIVESLTNVDLIRDLNNIEADEPLNESSKPKSLLGKLLDAFIKWLADVLGSDFKVNENSLFAKEYALFEEAVQTSRTRKNTASSTRTNRETNTKSVTSTEAPVQYVLKFEDEPVDVAEIVPGERDADVDNFTVKEITLLDSGTDIDTNTSSKLTIEKDNRTKAPKRKKGPKLSTISSTEEGLTFYNIRGALDNVTGETYFDIEEKINNGVISIKCR